ncbi:MAG: hypothetical protein FJX11_18365 [Alphaproteobacteria bacterium]|nr:hypothetical protein [Alphaproteobacteria bacterium]
MLAATEIARGVQGAVELLRRDPAASRRFDNTMEACLRSFRVMAVAAPIYGLYLLIGYSRLTVSADAFDVIAIEMMRYLVDWLLFPVLFYEIARRRGWLDRYPRYIGALNWINLPAMVIATLVIVVQSVTPTAVAGVIDIAQRAVFFYWFLVTTRMLLGADWGMSVVLLAVSWLPSLLLSILVARYVGVIGLAGA